MPYGFSTALTAGSHPPRVVSGTVNATTRGILRNEINNNTDEEDSNTPNINSNYRLDSTAFSKAASPAGEVYLANPFAGETEALTVFTTSGLNIAIEGYVALFPVDTWLQENLGADATVALLTENPDADDLAPGNTGFYGSRSILTMTPRPTVRLKSPSHLIRIAA